jgi:Na+-translocating ferredoxin:NAD+ oxidoreductase subunit B
MDRYERLREKLDAHPSGAPPAAAIGEILRLLFTPDEAEVAAAMTFVPAGVDEIASESGLAAMNVAARCEAMAAKGVVFAREKAGAMGYALLPIMPGVFEFPLLKGGAAWPPELGALWQAYHREAHGEAFAGRPTPLTRIIPVDRSIDTRPEVLPFEVLPEMLAHNETFAVGVCACRVSSGTCDKPLEVCLFFDATAKFLVGRSLAREITRDQALQVARDAEDSGLVHSTTNSQDRLGFLCNCCPCCCLLLRTLTELGNPNAFAVSRWQAHVDADRCDGCAACADGRCPVGAMGVEDGVARVDRQRCLGCGLCCTACPTDAVVMVQRDPAPQTPRTTAEMSLEVARQKGKLEAFLRLSRR